MSYKFAIFDLEGRVAFFDFAWDRAEARSKLASQDETYSDSGDIRVHSLDQGESELMQKWIDAGQKTNE